MAVCGCNNFNNNTMGFSSFFFQTLQVISLRSNVFAGISLKAVVADTSLAGHGFKVCLLGADFASYQTYFKVFKLPTFLTGNQSCSTLVVTCGKG